MTTDCPFSLALLTEPHVGRRLALMRRSPWINPFREGAGALERAMQSLERLAQLDIRLELGERTLNGLTINGAARNSSLSLPLTVVQFDQLLDRCRILRLLVSFPEGDQPRKA